MQRVWYRHDQEGVVAALRQGEPIDMVTTMNSGPLDELVALHEELGILAAVDELQPARQRRGIEDELLLRTAAILPFLPSPGLSTAAGQLFGEPAILLRLGWSPLQIRMGDNERHRHSEARRLGSLPCDPETVRDALERVSEACWSRLQRTGVRALFERRLVRGNTYAVDGTGLGPGLRLVCLVCVSAERPLIVAWRLLSGNDSEKGREAAVTRSLIEQVVELGGPGSIGLLLADALYADGPLLAWCKFVQGIDVLVPVPNDREIHRDLERMVQMGLVPLRHHSYVRRIQGHKQRRTVELGVSRGMTCWDSFIDAAQRYGAQQPQLWACLIRPVDASDPDDRPWTLVSTRDWSSGPEGYQAFRARWHIENDNYRELKEGWGLEAQRWGRKLAVQLARVALTCLAFNTAQVYLTRLGQRAAEKGIRRLRLRYRRELGISAAVVYIRQSFAVLPLETLVAVLGSRPRRSLLPAIAAGQPP
jgi:hypothetical protein